MREADKHESNGTAAEIIRTVEQRQRKQKLGCLAVVAVPICVMIIGLVGSQRENAEWRKARPAQTGEAEWEVRRDMCERISLGPSDCAVRPEREVKKLSDEVLARELAKICSDENPSDATHEAQKVTLSALRAPASADFVDSSTRTTHDGCIWTVTGEVDAQNSFGAKLRSPYRVKLQLTARDIWLPLEVKVQ